MERFLPSLYAADRYEGYTGLPSQFGFACPTALGNRLFIRSTSHLYGIGDPEVDYDWNPASRK